MNKNILFLAVPLVLSIFDCMAMSGPITTQVISPGSVENGTAYWYSDSASYVNGGLTFTFPTGLFVQKPNIHITVAVNSYSSLNTVSYVVTQVSNTSVTVRVNVGTLLTIGEAATNQVTVYIWAIGTAN